MSMDEKLYTLPIVGSAYERMHSYFRKHITMTDLLHVLTGFGVGLLFANKNYFVFAVLALFFGFIYHIIAYVKGYKKI